MRTIEQVQADLRALGRPVHPGCVGGMDPRLISQWRAARDAWRASNPQGEATYEALQAEWTAIEQAIEASRAKASVVGVARIPRRTYDALRDMKHTHATRQAEGWLTGPKEWLVLGGPVGTGKSVAAAHVLSRAVLLGRSGAWLPSSGVATMLGRFDEMAECERMKHLDVLVLDDFGTEHLSEFASSVFHEVLAARHENGVRTILTHNLTREALRRRLGSRLADRVAQSCVYVECVGESLRKSQPKEKP